MGEPLEVSALGDVSRGVRLNAAGLVQFAGARGIDLKHVAAVASNLDGVAKKRARTEAEKKLGIPGVMETAAGRETRSYRRPAFGVAELGQAAQGLGVLPWNAALYSYAGAEDAYWLLWSALSSEANHIARRESWAPRVITETGEERFYRETLSALVLDHDAHQHYFTAAPALYAVYMGVTPATWDSSLRDPFRSLRQVYDRWLSIARSAIGRWIRSED